MDNLIYPLIIAAITGLTYLAYKHPTAYQKLSTIILVLILSAGAAINAWNYAVAKSHLIAVDFIPTEKGLEALTAFKALEFSTFESFLLPFIAVGYHIFLLVLPVLIGERHKEKNT